MADKAKKVAGSAPGKFFVDEVYIDCDSCRAIAPDNFARSDNDPYSYVFKQPKNEIEQVLCVDALEACPVEAIGSDGD